MIADIDIMHKEDVGPGDRSHVVDAGRPRAVSTPDPVLVFPTETRLIPQVFLRNTTVAPLSVTLELDWRAPTQSGRFTLPQATF